MVLKFARGLSLAAMQLFLTGCYLAQAARGQLEVMRARQPIDKVIAKRADELVARARSNDTGWSYARQVNEDLIAVSRAIELLSAAEPPQGWGA